MSARWLTLLTWALVAGSAVFWGLRLAPPGIGVPGHASVATVGVRSGGDLSRLFGAEPVAPAPAAAAPAPMAPEQSRFQLVGLAAAAAAPSSGGVALIALDGKPPRAYRAGAVVDGAHVLQQVLPRSVLIGPRGQPAAFTLELPPLPPAATGVPPGATPAGLPAPGAIAMPQPAAPVVLQPPAGMGAAPSLAVQPPPAFTGNPGLGGPGSAAARLRALRPGGLPGGAAVQPTVQPGTDGMPTPGDGQQPVESDVQADPRNRR